MEVEFELDDQTYSIQVDPKISALRGIRTDTVYGCSKLRRGAFMVLFQDKRCVLCTLRVQNLYKKKIQTLDSVSTKDKTDSWSVFSFFGSNPCVLCTPNLLVKSYFIVHFERTSDQQNKAVEIPLCRYVYWWDRKKEINKKTEIGNLPMKVHVNCLCWEI